MNRQSSSCSRKGNSPHHSNSIGCMSGLLRLLSTYPRRRKSITFGDKQDRGVTVKPPDSEPVTLASKGGIGNEKQSQAKGLSPGRGIPRSPTLPAEIRSPTPGLVAKLMGLQDDMSRCSSLTPDTAAEKRRLLLGALEKCDEDLKTLKRVIQVVRMSVGGDGEDNKDGTSSLLTSPVPVPAVNGYSSKRCTDGRSWWPQRKTEEELRFTERITESICDAPKSVSPEGPFYVNKAMAESVEQVCRDIEWGEKREVGRIGLALQDYIYRDLIEETVKYMGRRRNTAFTSLPLEACKRRLSF